MKVGSIVMFTDSKKYLRYPRYYPPIRTLGTVIGTYESTEEFKVQWPHGSTSRNDCWWCRYEDVIELSSKT